MITGTFRADFSSFYDAVTTAIDHLAGLEGESSKVAASLDSMSKGFDPAPAVDAAAKIEGAIVDVGDAAKKSSDDVEHLGGAASTSTSGFTTLATGLSTADKTLGAFGVHIGHEIGALQELGAAAGKTAADIGLIGTASLIAGAALGGWSIGRKIADLTGSDAAIGNLTASILGWGNAAEETARYQAELTERAREFGFVGNDAAAAAEFLRTKIGEQQEVFNTGAQRVKIWNDELNRAKAEGVPGLRAEIEAGNSTVAEMAEHYGVSARAVEYLSRVMRDEAVVAAKDTAAANAEAAKRMADAAAAAAKLADAQKELDSVGADWKATLAGMNAELVDTLQYYADAGVSASALATVYNVTDAQLKAVTESIKAQATAFADEQKAIDQTRDLWRQLGTVQQERTATTTQKMIDGINTWAQKEMETVAASNAMWETHKNLVLAIVEEQTAGIRVNWDSLKTYSIADLQDIADRAKATYEQVRDNAGLYLPEAVEFFRVAAEKAALAADPVAQAWKKAMDEADAAMAAAAAAANQTTAAVNTQATAVDGLARSYTAMMHSADEWRTMAAGMEADAQATLTQPGGGIFGYRQFQESAAASMREQANKRAQYEQYLASAGAGYTRNASSTAVTVNAYGLGNGDDVAAALIAGMRSRGVPLG